MSTFRGSNQKENQAIQDIIQYQKDILNQRSQSIKNLSKKITEYIPKIRKELSFYIKETQNHQNMVQAEARKLGKNRF